LGERRSKTPAQGWRIVATVFGLASAALSCGPALAEQSATRATSSLFGAIEIGSHDLSRFPKWRRTLRAFEAEVENCRASRCGSSEWQATVDRLRGKDLMTQLREANALINEKRYVADRANWAVPDYWATPFEFLRKAGGDCEDYAIAKYMVLRDLGIPVDDMRIAVLKDIRRHIDHAVLAVYIDGTPFILDNRYSDIVQANSLHDYQPVYSINEHGWWLHRPALGSSAPAMPTAPLNGADGDSFAAQLASLSTNDHAMQASAEIRARYAAILTDSEIDTRRVDLGAMGTWYRVLVGPFGSRSAAGSLCAQLRGASPPADCIVIAYNTAIE
jgi:predicted transglutaminase-like cysteine proteinase